jgi:hypothetical protein
MTTARCLLAAAIAVAAPSLFGAPPPAAAPLPADPPCLAIGLPAVQGIPGNATEFATGVRELLTTFLGSPSLKVLALDSRLPSQQAQEAKEKGCGQLLVVSVTRHSGGSRFTHALGEAAGSTAWMVPGGGGGAASIAAHAATAGGLRAASSLAASTKSRDELQIEYRVVAASGAVQYGPRTEKQKAAADGEDLLTPAVTRVADAIVTQGKR